MSAERERDRRAVHTFIQTIPDDDDDKTTTTTTTPKGKGKKAVTRVAPVVSKEDQEVEDAMEDEELDTNFVFDSTRAGGASASASASAWSFNAMKKNAVKQNTAHMSLDEKIRQRMALRRLESERAKVEAAKEDDDDEEVVLVSQHQQKKKKKKKTN
jgi:hypothetical protein